MPTPEALDPDSLARRLEAIPALERIRDAAGVAPAYLVGGAVRDLLLGLEVGDLDVVVEGEAAVVARALEGEPLAGGRFATARATVGGMVVDLAGARAESYREPGALPDVRPATLEDDLARRDFTVNAMAVPLHAEPQLVDPHAGAADLRARVLRVLHPGSFVDDPTRALRAARYAARFGFALDPETERLARAADLDTVSPQRVDADLVRLAGEPHARAGFELLDAWGLVRLPDGAGAAIDSVAALLERPPWAGAVDRPAAVHAAATGRTPGVAGQGWDVAAAARRLAASDPARPSEAAELARGHDEVELLLARAIGAEWTERYVAEWAAVELEIDGDDLRAAGVDEGPAIGRGLDAALRRKLDGELSGREAELRAALDAARG